MELLSGVGSALMAAPWAEIGKYLGAATALLLFAAACVRACTAVVEWRRSINAARLQAEMRAAENISSFTTSEIKGALANYVEPDCAQLDPSNESDLRKVANIRAPVMKSVKDFINSGGKHRFLLILADSGMGKTTFCLNFFARNTGKSAKNEWKIAIVPLSRPEAVPNIRRISEKDRTVLLLDAFDEDERAINDAGERLAELMAASADFMAVIVTCRSQFFLNDASIPTETGVAVIRPRKAGEDGGYKFYKLYLQPFSAKQIKEYVDRTYTFWHLDSARSRKSAMQLVQDIPELSVRPMLLALIPDLIKERRLINELYELYGFMVERWLQRESKWIDKEKLLTVSKKLAVFMYATKGPGKGDRVTLDELQTIAAATDEELHHWQHLTARSLLNRDSEGRFKFAHRSIMEFLYVSAALDGETKCFSVPWTDLMRELFVSWGRTAAGRTGDSRAQEILEMDLRVARLSPLGSTLQEPKFIPPADLVRRLSRAQATSSTRRELPAQWRFRSLRMKSDVDTHMVYDFAHDLTWRLARTDQFGEQSDLEVFRYVFSDIGRLDHGDDGFRLPSLDEFISLMDAETTLAPNALIDRRGVYWLADQCGKSRYLVLTVGDTQISDPRLTLIGSGRPKAHLDLITLYEVQIRSHAPGERVGFSAMALLVRSGETELAWCSVADWSEPGTVTPFAHRVEKHRPKPRVI